MPFTLQVTVVSVELEIVAANVSVSPSNTTPVVGVTLTEMEGGGGGGCVTEPAPPPRSPESTQPSRGARLPAHIRAILANSFSSFHSLRAFADGAVCPLRCRPRTSANFSSSNHSPWSIFVSPGLNPVAPGVCRISKVSLRSSSNTSRSAPKRIVRSVLKSFPTFPFHFGIHCRLSLH